MINTAKTALSYEVITARAILLKQLREFMSVKGVLEVETPYLSKAANSDPAIINLSINSKSANDTRWYLHSSPEFPMKRLLSSGVGSIYQICRVFREEESGQQHNTEFTMLEYYRLGFDHYDLMHELDELLQYLGLQAANKQSYRDCFLEELGIDLWQTDTESLVNISQEYGLVSSHYDRAMCIDFLFSHSISPKLGLEQPCFIFDYPCEQHALAKVRDEDGNRFAERFEVFINGMEIANAYHELNNREELSARFKQDIEYCQQHNLPYGPVDDNLLSTTDELPDCAGVAIGIDRLLMALLKLDSINEVLCFPSNQA